MDRYENGTGIAYASDLQILMEEEGIIRPSAEIDALLASAKATGDPLLEEILRSRSDYIVDFHIIDEPPPELGSLVDDIPVSKAIISVLKAKKISYLYKFQEEAIKKILQGNNVVITAPTASGKTEAFCIPVLHHLAAEEVSRFGSLRVGKGKVFAIFVYPTKALSRDQLLKIEEMAAPLGVRVSILDGDSSEKDRRLVIESPPDVLITNFDVLHYHMIHKTRFSRILRTAKLLIVDEAHVYTGIFGANVHHIISRLERLVGSRLQIIAASATLPNAAEFCQTLFGRHMELISGRGRRGRMNLAIIFPSLRSYRSLMLDLLRQTTKRKHRTILFASSHLSSELMAFYG
ncbi:MAG: DEAD/DEAH box helicase, partial [Thermoproteota archaeon]|nr:DEAD/DEAH box helicase [Thermoproteota archaeon]